MPVGPVVRDRGSRPTVAVLTPRWESTSEEGWVTRQVAGALACHADVDVVVLDGDRAETVTDSVFTVHRLAVGPAGGTDPWGGASDILTTLAPDSVLIAGHRSLGALRALDRLGKTVPVVLLALDSGADRGARPTVPAPFGPISAVLVVTGDEADSVSARMPGCGPIHRLGAPLAANPGARSEPDAMVGDSDAVLVITGAPRDDPGEQGGGSQLVRVYFPDRTVAVVHDDAFRVWHRGRLKEGPPVTRSSDLARLMAWAWVTVDLRPGPLFARRTIESLLYGTPVVVPRDSRGRQHAALGKGGLWYSGPVELVGCIEAMLDPSTHDPLSRQGRTYAAQEYGSTDRFIERVVTACGLG